jgi:hypothetical protein
MFYFHYEHIERTKILRLTSYEKTKTYQNKKLKKIIGGQISEIEHTLTYPCCSY